MTTTATEDRVYVNAWRHLNQGETWLPKPPREPIAVTDMDLAWRWNSAQGMIRGAEPAAWAYGWGEMFAFGGVPDDVDEERMRDPQAWMRTTTLYRALVAGLPAQPGELVALADSARHWGHCPARGDGACQCEAGPAPAQADLDAVLLVILDIKAKEERAERKRQEAAERAVRREWMVANPDLDPDTLRPWHVDEDGVNHSEPHGLNEHCQFDSCSCGGYHCGLDCSDGDRDREDQS